MLHVCYSRNNYSSKVRDQKITMTNSTQANKILLHFAFYETNYENEWLFQSTLFTSKIQYTDDDEDEQTSCADNSLAIEWEWEEEEKIIVWIHETDILLP